MEGSDTEAPIKINPEFTVGITLDGLDELVTYQPETPKWKGFIRSIFENTVASIIASLVITSFAAYIIGFQSGATEKTIVRESPKPFPTQSCEPTRYARSK